MHAAVQHAVSFLFRWRVLLGILLLLAMLAIAISPIVDLPPRLLTPALALLLLALCATILALRMAVPLRILLPAWAQAAATPVPLWPAAEGAIVRRC